MTAFAFAFAVPAAKWLRLNGTMLGLFGTQIIFQGIVAAALFVKSSRVAQQAGLASRSTAVAE
jgi:hypothetical protein